MLVGLAVVLAASTLANGLKSSAWSSTPFGAERASAGVDVAGAGDRPGGAVSEPPDRRPGRA